jgi:membrane-bound lytic murein transglycosylase MltF
VKSGEFPFHKKLAGNFTTQVESHYQIDDLDNNLQKSKAELEAPGAIYEEKEMSNRTIPSGINGTKSPEEYANIIILKKESAEATGSNKQQQRIYKISRP